MGSRLGAARSKAAAGCPCGSGHAYSRCCGPRHRGSEPAVTAEQLMRSRYSAFAKGLLGYLQTSWHPSTRPADLALDPAVRWTGLEIVAVEGGGEGDSDGTVEFVARCIVDGHQRSLREISRFERLDGAWVYVAPAELSGP